MSGKGTPDLFAMEPIDYNGFCLIPSGFRHDVRCFDVKKPAASSVIFSVRTTGLPNGPLNNSMDLALFDKFFPTDT